MWLQEAGCSTADAEAKQGWGAGWPAGTEKLVLSQEYLGDPRTERVSHAWTGKSHLNLIGKPPWGCPGIATEGVFWGPGVPPEFEARLKAK